MEGWNGHVSRIVDGGLLRSLRLFDSLGESSWGIAALTWGTLIVEGLLPLALWFRPTRHAAMVVGIAFHLLIELNMHLFLFEWIMIVGLLSFWDRSPSTGVGPHGVGLRRLHRNGVA